MQGLDAVRDIAFNGGRVSAIAESLDEISAKRVEDISRKILSPGLLDLHTHVYWGGTGLGVKAEPVARRSGTTTFIDAGSAGAGNYAGFQSFIADPTPLNIYGFLNISFAGICGFSCTTPNLFPECEDIRLLDTAECVRTAREYAHSVVGIKVRIGRYASGNAGLIPLQIAREVAEELKLPLMTHVDFPPPDRDDVLNILRPGDILTHCFRPFPNAPVDGQGSIRESVRKARERGVYFDLGHGAGSLSFKVSRQMLEQNFLPDTISSDVHQASINGPAFDNLVTMSKFLCLGMPLDQVICASTATPAKAIGRTDLGTLEVGAQGDAVVLNIEDGEFEYHDVTGDTFTGKQRLVAEKVILQGEIWHEQGSGQ
jgi:dihydroorotase